MVSRRRWVSNSTQKDAVNNGHSIITSLQEVYAHMHTWSYTLVFIPHIYSITMYKHYNI